MPRTRPISVLVIAIMHFVLGGLGLCCGLFAVASSVFTFVNPGVGAGAPSANLAVAQYQYLDAHAPFWKEIALTFNVLDLVISVLVIAAGVGLLLMKAWGRTLSLLYGGGSLVDQIGRLVYTLFFFIPALLAFYDSFAASAPPGPQTQVLNMMKPFMSAAPFINMLGLIYPVIVLIIMLRPSVAAAFRNEPTGPENFGDRYDDRTPPAAGYGQDPQGYSQEPPGCRQEPDDR